MLDLERSKTEYYDKYFGHELAKIGPENHDYLLVLCATGLRGKPMNEIQATTRDYIFANWKTIFKDVVIKEDDELDCLLIELDGNAFIKTMNGEKIPVYQN